jgi:acetyl-CoA carboxylase biotin carboxyl carrier protein
MTDSAPLDEELIRTLADLLDEKGLTEIEWNNGALTVRVARQGSAAVFAAPAVAGAPQSAAHSTQEPTVSDPGSHPGAVLSPMVGTAYVAPEPGAAAFVSAGDRVSEGQTVLIIEAMKTMNPIPAPRSGTVRQILVSDGIPVEYGEVLMIIE